VAEIAGKVDLIFGIDNREALTGMERVKQTALSTGKEVQSAFAIAGAAVAGSAFLAYAKQIADVGIAAESATVRLDSLAGRFGESAEAQRAAASAAQLLNLSQTEAASGFAQLFAALRPTGVGLSDIETIFVGVTAAAKNTGLSAESVNNALIQLTQGLASGRLQGDELRSVLEQLPPLSQAIARELQVPVGSLKQLGSEGKITTDVIIKALDRLKATELGSLDKSLSTSAETLKRLSIQTERFQLEISKLFGSETLEGVRTLTKAVGDLTELVKAAARASKDLKDNLPKGASGPSIRTGSLPVDFLIAQADVISQGKFTNEIEAGWNRLIGQAKLYGEAKNIALAAGRYIPPDQQVGFKSGGKSPEQLAQELKVAAEARAAAEEKIVKPAREQLQLAEAALRLSSNDLDALKRAADLEKLRNIEIKAQAEYRKAFNSAGGDTNNQGVINAGAALEKASLNVKAALLDGARVLRDSAADTTLFEKQAQLALQGLNQRIAKAKELAAIEDQGQRGAVAAADAVLQSITEATRKQQEISLQLQNQAAKGGSTEEIRSTLAASVQAGREVELALINGGRALADQLKAAGDRLTDTLTGNFNILNQQGKEIVLAQAEANITRGVQTGLIDVTKIPSRNDAAGFIQFSQQSKAIADAFENNAVTQKTVAAAQSQLAASLNSATEGIQTSFNSLTEAIPSLVTALNTNANADRSITVTVNADTGQTYIQQATALQ
jgi:tape measure domain-containing protein